MRRGLTYFSLLTNFGKLMEKIRPRTKTAMPIAVVAAAGILAQAQVNTSAPSTMLMIKEKIASIFIIAASIIILIRAEGISIRLID